MARPLSFAPFDVVVVPFPYSDRVGDKRRPAVVVSRPEVERQHGWRWLAMITSSPGIPRIGDVLISDLGSAGLNRTCRVRAAKIAVLDEARIVRRTGALDEVDRRELVKALAACAAW